MAGRVLTARRSLQYAGKRVKKGEQFYARGDMARALVAVGYASETPTPIQSPQPKAEPPRTEPPAHLPDDTKPEPDTILIEPDTAEVGSLEQLNDKVDESAREMSEAFDDLSANLAQDTPKRTRPYRRRGGKAPEE